MKLKQRNIKGFLHMVFHLYFSFALKRRWCWQFVLRKFQVKVFGPKGRKFLATKSKNLGASWPQRFFCKVEPWFGRSWILPFFNLKSIIQSRDLRFTCKCLKDALFAFICFIQEIWRLIRESGRFGLHTGDSWVIWESWHRWCRTGYNFMCNLFSKPWILTQLMWNCPCMYTELYSFPAYMPYTIATLENFL